MKKIIFLIITIFIILVLSIIYIYTGKPKSNLKHIKVAEVTHSIFYAPQYVAKHLGYFQEEGLDVEFILTPGADKVTASVLSNDVQIGLAGSEATIYVYNQGEKDYLINFAALTKKDGSFIVSRKKIDNFTLEDMKGKTVIGGRKGVRHNKDNKIKNLYMKSKININIFIFINFNSINQIRKKYFIHFFNDKY